MSALTILLVEDEPEICQTYAAYAEQMEDISLIGETADATEAVKMIQDNLPDVIILDLELPKGRGSGLDLLRDLQDTPLAVEPYIVVVTNNINDVTREYARSLGVGFIISKYQAGYSEKYVLDFLRPMKDMIQSTSHVRLTPEGTPETPAQRKNRMTKRIHAELDRIGINPKSLGYKYLTDGILIVIESETTYLCDKISKRYGKSAASVERAMQGAINKAWQTTDIDELLTLYTSRISSYKGVPTLTEFVYHYARKLRDEYRCRE